MELPNRYFPDPVTHNALLMMGDSKALAYQWITEYAKNISPGEPEDDDPDYYRDVRPVTAEEMIDAAASQQGEQWGGDYICRGGEYEGFRVDGTFWDKFAIVMGIERNDVEESNFFTCSC